MSELPMLIGEVEPSPSALNGKTHLISQSEVDTYLSCKRKHYYAFGEPNSDGSRGIQPQGHSESLTRGTIGHGALADGYQTVIDGGTWADAKQAAGKYLVKVATVQPEQMAIVNQLIGILSAYFDYYQNELIKWQPLVVEREFRYDVPGTNMVFPFKPDAVMRRLEDGKIFVWDHKFLYNFYSDRTLPIQPQLPKYVHILRLMGFEVYDGMYNQLSTRKGAKNAFDRVPLGIKDKAAERFFAEQIDAMMRIRQEKERHPLVWRNEALRTASAFNCKNCPFLEVCIADLHEQNGRDLLVRTFYSPNTYGYKEAESSE